MKRSCIHVVVLLVFMPLFARADRKGGFIYIPPASVGVVQAETVVAGKVTGIDEKPVASTLDKNDPQKVEYRVFTLKIDHGIKGTRGLTHIKVGLPMPLAPAIQPRPRPGILGPITLEKDQEALLFLQPHHSEAFFVPTTLQSIVDKRTPNYKIELETTVHLCKLLDDPTAGLQSKVEEDRYLTAALLVSKYRMQLPGATKEVEIPVEESKRILQGLLVGKWDVPDTRNDGYSPIQVFMQLNPQQAGWTPPNDFRQQAASMKKWIEENVDKYRVRRFEVPAKP